MSINKNKYYISAIAAFVIWGLFSFALKPLKQYASLDILFYRVFFSATLISIYAFYIKRMKMRENFNRFISLNESARKKTILLTLVGGALLTANWFVFIFVINKISIKAAAYAYLVCPILTTLFAYFIINEKLHKHQWIATFISILSIVILAIFNFQDLMYSLIVAVSYAFYLITQRKNNQIDKLPILTFQLVFAALILLPFYPKYSSELPSETSFYLLIILISVVFTILPLLLNLFAIEGLPSATVGVLLYINPILNFIIAIVYYNEATTNYQLLSYFLVILSVIVYNKNYLFNKKQIV